VFGMVGLSLGLYDCREELVEPFQHSHSTTYVQRIEQNQILSHKFLFCLMTCDR
jgi:hypothetical protein